MDYFTLQSCVVYWNCRVKSLIEVCVAVAEKIVDVTCIHACVHNAKEYQIHNTKEYIIPKIAEAPLFRKKSFNLFKLTDMQNLQSIIFSLKISFCNFYSRMYLKTRFLKFSSWINKNIAWNCTIVVSPISFTLKCISILESYNIFSSSINETHACVMAYVCLLASFSI